MLLSWEILWDTAALLILDLGRKSLNLKSQNTAGWPVQQLHVPSLLSQTRCDAIHTFMMRQFQGRIQTLSFELTTYYRQLTYGHN